MVYSLLNIQIKKTSKKKVVRVQKKNNISKLSKKTSKKINKTKKSNISITSKYGKTVKEENKIDNLRIPKSNEIKPEIKKIKKQETAKKEYKIKDYIVYPKHGVGQILSISSKAIGGIEVQCYDIKFERDKAIGLLPINKQSNLRSLSTINQINKSISILKSGASLTGKTFIFKKSGV